MKSKIMLIISSSLLLSTCLMAMEEQHAPKVELINDTKDPITIKIDYQELPPLVAGKIYPIELPHLVKNFTVKYTGSTDLSAKSIDIQKITSQAQVNDALIHIVPAKTFGVTVGKIEYKSPLPEVEEQKTFPEEEKTELEKEGGFKIIEGLTEDRRKAYDLLGATGTSSAYKVLGIEPGASQEEIERAYIDRNRYLFSQQKYRVNPILKDVYLALTKNAFDDLAKPLSPEEETSYQVLEVPRGASAYEVLKIEPNASVEETKKAFIERTRLLPKTVKEPKLTKQLREVYSNITHRALTKILAEK